MSGYVGRGINYGNAVVDHFTGNGGATYTLNYDTTTNGVVVSLDGVVQKNGTDFNVTGTSLVFTSTVANPIAIQVIYTGLTLSIGTPGDGTVTNSSVDASAAIASSKISGLGTAATVDTGTSANQIVKLDGSAKIPAIDGSQLTNLPSDITKSTSEPAADTNPSGGVGSLWLRTTTGEMYCCTDSTTNANIWTNIGDGTGGQPDISTATGGTITTSGDYKFHAFTSSGTFTVGSLNNSNYDVLTIAGGGAAGWYEGGGGGAGGLVYQTGVSLATSTAYTVTIGAGGTSHISSNAGMVGTDTTFGSVHTAKGGGAGARYDYSPAGTTGGSGGGGGHSGSPYTGYAATQASQSGDSGTYGFGNAGGEAYNGGGNNGGSGGGGGAGGKAPDTGETNGANASDQGGDGGVGKEISLFSAWGTASDNTGTSGGWFAGGGSGGRYNSPNNGIGGAGGGGNGGYGNTNPGSNGAANTGGGAGGGGSHGSQSMGGNGGSGIVLIRYKFQ
mgnify:CR=1 FL=1